MADGETTGDAIYRWTIRGLYIVAIGLNVWLLWDMMADDTQTAIVKAKVRDAWHRMTAPFRLEQTIAKETGPMLWEATQIVEGA